MAEQSGSEQPPPAAATDLEDDPPDSSAKPVSEQFLSKEEHENLSTVFQDLAAETSKQFGEASADLHAIEEPAAEDKISKADQVLKEHLVAVPEGQVEKIQSLCMLLDGAHLKSSQEILDAIGGLVTTEHHNACATILAQSAAFSPGRVSVPISLIGVDDKVVMEANVCGAIEIFAAMACVSVEHNSVAKPSAHAGWALMWKIRNREFSPSQDAMSLTDIESDGVKRIDDSAPFFLRDTINVMCDMYGGISVDCMAPVTVSLGYITMVHAEDSKAGPYFVALASVLYKVACGKTWGNEGYMLMSELIREVHSAQYRSLVDTLAQFCPRLECDYTMLTSERVIRKSVTILGEGLHDTVRAADKDEEANEDPSNEPRTKANRRKGPMGKLKNAPARKLASVGDIPSLPTLYDTQDFTEIVMLKTRFDNLADAMDKLQAKVRDMDHTLNLMNAKNLSMSRALNMMSNRSTMPAATHSDIGAPYASGPMAHVEGTEDEAVLELIKTGPYNTALIKRIKKTFSDNNALIRDLDLSKMRSPGYRVNLINALRVQGRGSISTATTTTGAEAGPSA